MTDSMLLRALIASGLAACGFPTLPGLGGSDAGPDPCATAKCECTVATQDSDCGAHQVCDDSGPGRLCKCAPAYADKGAGCVFDVAPRDPGFMDATAWTATGDGAQINAAAAGGIDPGRAEITGAGMCAASMISQTFMMPPLSKAQPFKVSVTYAMADTGGGRGGLFGTLSVDVGGRFFERSAANAPATDSFCLGDKDYGRAIDFRIRTRGGPTCPNTLPGSLSVDQLIVQPVTTDECPLPGTITNSDFEGTNGWAFTVENGATAAIVAGAGESSSRAGQLATTTRCSQAFMTGMLAVPEQLANPALDVYYGYTYTGIYGGRLSVSFDNKNISVLPARLTPGHAHICLPKWALGTTGALGFLMPQDAAGAGPTENACTTAMSRTWSIDNVKLVSDATCGATSDNADGGFERYANFTGPTAGWGLIDGSINDIKGATAEMWNNAADAHTGQASLRLAAFVACAPFAGADLSFIVPPPDGAAGPALKLFANVGANPNSDTTVTISPEVRFVIPEQGVYAQQIVCIPKRLANRLVTARISTLGVGTSCTTVFDEHAFIDDVQITTDPSCTAE